MYIYIFFKGNVLRIVYIFVIIVCFNILIKLYVKQSFVLVVVVLRMVSDYKTFFSVFIIIIHLLNVYG